MITKLLVANRAEIASRVFRTCRDLGIATVAVHSDPDADLPYVREAQQAVRLAGSSPADTYLRVDLLLAAATATGADAVHPGYGFLSENAGFAQAVLDAGLVWVGPSPASIAAMGSKIEAKRLMVAAGVPVLPDRTVATATQDDLPLLVKASAGGGGRGMRVVRSLEELAGEVEQASAEAQSAFGDGTVFVESYVEQGRHVEVQVLGLPSGEVLVLGERDCSLQRRHQKVLEESPAPGLSEQTRTALHEAARTAATAIDYLGAGTVEFLYDPARDRFSFLEMNTRLQVEHPVTELVHGLDLVAAQLAVAEGRDVDAPGPPSGHAVEVRLYAEDAARSWQPQSGLLTRFEIPAGQGIRVDAGFATGNEVSTHYDAMLAKVVAWAPTREQAARRLAATLRASRLHGVTTNRDLLVDVLQDRTFLKGDVSTAFLDTIRSPDRPGPRVAALAATVALAERARLDRTVQQGIPVAWRNVVSQPQVTRFEGADVHWWGGRPGYRFDGATVIAAGPDAVVLDVDGVRGSFEVAVVGDRVDVDGPGGHHVLVRLPRFPDPADAVATGSLLAPMPGTVLSVAAAVGDAVRAGQAVFVLEAMKMQHTITAPAAGTLTQLQVVPGAQVSSGQVLALVEAVEPPEGATP